MLPTVPLLPHKGMLRDGSFTDERILVKVFPEGDGVPSSPLNLSLVFMIFLLVKVTLPRELSTMGSLT